VSDKGYDEAAVRAAERILSTGEDDGVTVARAYLDAVRQADEWMRVANSNAETAQEAEAALAEATAALDVIANWTGCGQDDRAHSERCSAGSHDEPGSMQAARDVLARLDARTEGTDQ